MKGPTPPPPPPPDRLTLLLLPMFGTAINEIGLFSSLNIFIFRPFLIYGRKIIAQNGQIRCFLPNVWQLIMSDIRHKRTLSELDFFSLNYSKFAVN